MCHAPGVLRHVKNPQTGESVVRGKRVTGFTNSEEAAVELTEVVPFLVEDMLKTNGAEFERSADWRRMSSPTAADHGQNPASSEPAAEALLAQLGRR